MRPVWIILSTYNGSAFLGEQLESIRRQSHRSWRLLWRDDGSTDNSMQIVRDFASRVDHGQVVNANDNLGRLGVGRSFLTLLRRVPPGHITAFSDQDDVWLKDKLARGLAVLKTIDQSRPTLYCSGQTIVDARLRPVGQSIGVPVPPGFPQSLAQNVATGCTIMLNPAAVLLINAFRPKRCEFHDWWSYVLVTAADGIVVSDPQATVLYRQHYGNAVGLKTSFLARGLAALRRGPTGFMTTLRAHVSALEERYELLGPDARQVLSKLSPALQSRWPGRLAALRQSGMRRRTFLETQVFRLWFLLG